MKKKKESKIIYKNYISIFLVVLLIILIFTFIDFLIHLLSEEYSVPSYYFRNKIIYGSIIGLLIYFFVKNEGLLIKSLIFSVVVSVLLQVRYFLEGYPLKFVMEFLVIHFLILFPVSLIIFKFFEKLITKYRLCLRTE